MADGGRQIDVEQELGSVAEWQAELLYLAADIKPYNPEGAERLRQLAARIGQTSSGQGRPLKLAAGAEVHQLALRLAH